MNKVEDFLNEYTSKQTKRLYTISLNNYFTFQGKKPDKYIIDVRNLENGQRNEIMDGYEKDITKYRNHLTSEGYSPKSISNYIGTIKMFLEHYKINLDNSFWKKLHKRGMEKVTEAICDFKIPSRNELKQILTHANTKPRAMFLLQSSSGMRIGEICNLTLDDIDLDYEYPRIRIKDTKTRRRGKTRCSPEAKEAIQEYLKVRSKNNDSRLFQCTPKSARNMWNRLLKKSGYTKKDNNGMYPRHLMGTHTLRKFFRNEFSKYDNDLATYLMNQRSRLDRTYRQWADEYLDEKYSEGVQHLMVFQTNVTDEKVSVMEEKMKQLQMQNQAIEDMKMQILELRLTIMELKNKKK
jgi:integrase